MKVKCIRQHDKNDCGAACLATIARYYGVRFPLAYFRNNTKTSTNGVSIYGIVECAKLIGIKATAYQASISDLYSEVLSYPLIARITTMEGLDHFIVIKKITSKFVYVSDPAEGNKKYKLCDFERIYDGYIISCYPDVDIKPIKEKSQCYYLFKNLVKKNIRFFIVLFIISLIVSFCGILLAYGIRYAIQTMEDKACIESKYDEVSYDVLQHEHTEECEFSEHHEEDQLYYGMIENVLFFQEYWYELLALLVGAILLKSLLDYIRKKFTLKLGIEFNKKVAKELTEKILSMPVNMIDNWHSGALITRYSDAEIISEGLINSTLTVLIDSVMLVIGAYVLCQQSVVLFLVTLITVLFYIILIFVFVNPIKTNNIKLSASFTNKNKEIKEVADGLFSIKALSIRGHIQRKIDSMFDKYMATMKKNRDVEFNQVTLISLISDISDVLILFIALGLISKGEITIATFVAYTSLTDFFVQPVENLISLQFTIQNAVVAGGRLSDILDGVGVLEENKDDNINDNIIKNEIRLDNILFRYGNGMPVFEGYSCTVPVGKHTLICGNNGCGKSTLGKIIAGLYTVELGKIFVNTRELKTISYSNWNKNVLYIGQNSFFFSDSIRSNICIGQQEYTDIEVKTVCKIVGIDDFIEQLPQKYNTMMEEGGHNFSTGQLQKLAIARALIRKPKLLILDEATSNVDSHSEVAIYNNIFNYLDGITVVSVMHKLNPEIEASNILHL